MRIDRLAGTIGTRGGASRQASMQRARTTIGPGGSSRSRCTRPAIVPPPLSSAVVNSTWKRRAS